MATRTLEITFIGNSQPVTKAFAEVEQASGGLQGALGKVGAAFGDMAKVAGGFVMAEGIMKAPGFLMDAANAAIEDEAAWKKVEQAVRNASGAFDENIQKVQERVAAGQALAYTDGEIQDSFTTLLAATGDVDEALNRQTVAMDLARGAGISLEQASRLVGKVNEENVEQFKRLGITIGEGATEAEALAAVQAKFAGQADTYAASTAGQFEQAKIRLGEVKEAIGAELLPVITTLAEVFLNQVVPAIERFVAAAGPAIRQFAEDVRRYWESDIKPAIDNMVAAWQKVEPVVRPLLEFMGRELKRLGEIVGNMVQLIVNLISGDFSGAWENAKNIVRLFWESVEDRFRTGLQFIQGLGTTMLQAGKDLMNALKEGLFDIWNRWIGPFFRDLPATIGRFFDGAGQWLLDIGKAILQGLWDGMKEMWGEVSGWVGGLGGKIKDLKGPLERDLVLLQEEGRAIMQGLQTGMEDGFVPVERALRMMTAKLKEVAAREAAAIAIAGAGAGGWAPSSAALAPGTGTPTGAYGQGLVWDQSQLSGRGAWVLPQDIGQVISTDPRDRFFGFDKHAYDAERLYESGAFPRPQVIRLEVDGQVLAEVVNRENARAY